jgi:hypothetical protein
MIKNRFNRLQRREARVHEVQLRHFPMAFLWMLGVPRATQKPSSAQTQTQLPSSTPMTQCECETIQPSVIEDMPRPLMDDDMDSWNDPLDIGFFDVWMK